MGTQQILMIVLSVIVVGSAIAVGIDMFDNQSRNMTRSAIISDFIQMGINIQAYYRTPAIYGGAGNSVGRVVFTDLMSFINAGDTSATIRSPFGVYNFEDPGNNDFVDITLPAIPTISGWTALARVYYDGRTDAALRLERGIWTYVGPIENVLTPP
jgi:hypothetical protein